MTIKLPPDVTVQRTPLSASSFEYIFRHSVLGELGRLLLKPAEGGVIATPIVFSPAGDDNNGRRREIFEPLAISLTVHIQNTSRRS
jgi:hypothetical protein